MITNKQKQHMKKFGSEYPCGPCPNEWENCVCECGWVFNKEEAIIEECEEQCEVCDYCGSTKCPKCGKHLHCGGCV